MKLIQWYEDKGFTSVGEGVNTLKEELGIRVKKYPEEGLYVFNYDQIASPKTHPVVMECRGLILAEDFTIVCRPFERFFKLGEALNITQDFNIEDAYIFEKADGSLVKLYYWNDSWRVGTRGTAFAEVENYTGQIFQDMIVKAFGCHDLEELNDILEGDSAYVNRGNTYLFEFISPENRVVTPYSEPKMVYLGSKNNTTGEEGMCTHYHARAFSGAGLNVRAPDFWSKSSIGDVKKFVNSLKDLQEGVVAWDKKSGLRVKVKSDHYVAVHRLRGELVPSQKNIMELVVTNETDEYLTYFPEEKGRFEPIADAWDHLQVAVGLNEAEYFFIEDQKEFALKIKNRIWKSVLFTARKSGKRAIEVLHSLDPVKKVRMLQQYMEIIDNDA